MEPIARTYPYRPQPRILVAWGLFCAVGALVFAYEGATNDRALEIHGPFPLGFTKEGATVFYWVAAATCLAFVGVCVYYLKLRQRIVIDDQWLHYPKSAWNTAEEQLAFTDMLAIKLGSQTYLASEAAVVFIQHRSGLLALSAAYFSTDEAFAGFYKLLRDRFNDCHPDEQI